MHTFALGPSGSSFSGPHKEYIARKNLGEQMKFAVVTMRFVGIAVPVAVAGAMSVESVANLNSRVSVSDPHPLSEQEQYLAPYLDQLVDYRDNPIARRYITLANLVDAVPTWIEDLFIPLFIPGSTLTIPINKTMEVKIPIGGLAVNLNITVHNAILTGLDEFKKLRPLKLLDSGRFTWGGNIVMKELTAFVSASFSLMPGTMANVSVNMHLVNPSIDFSMILAFNHSRLCDVWGSVMKSSVACAMWPLSVLEDAGVSGVNMTFLRLGLGNFTTDISITGLGSPDFEKALDEAVQTLIAKERPTILANLSGSLSQQALQMANEAFLHQIPRMQRESPCSTSALAPTVNVSKVCFSNNGGYLLKWAYHNCPTHLASPQTAEFPIDQSRCMDVKSIWPDAQVGQVLRVSTEAIAGLHEISDPALRYVPDSNSAGFECSGTTFDYSCKFVSVAPVEPSVNPQVQKVCVINHAGFVMHYEVQNKRTGSWVAKTGDYPIDQTQCIDLSTTASVKEGDIFDTKAGIPHPSPPPFNVF